MEETNDSIRATIVMFGRVSNEQVDGAMMQKNTYVVDEWVGTETRKGRSWLLCALVQKTCAECDLLFPYLIIQEKRKR